MKLLNLDELVTVEKAIKVKGVEHDVVDRSIGQVIKAIKFTKDSETNSESDNIETIIELILESIPSCPKGDLLTYPISSLNKILSFLNESDSEVVTEDVTGGK